MMAEGGITPLGYSFLTDEYPVSTLQFPETPHHILASRPYTGKSAFFLPPGKFRDMSGQTLDYHLPKRQK
jgi:hypothetical protein